MPSLPFRCVPDALRPAVAAALGLAAGLLVPAACPVPIATAADGLSLGGDLLPNQAVPSVPDVLAGTGTRYIIGRAPTRICTRSTAPPGSRAVRFRAQEPEPGDDQNVTTT